MKKNLDVTKREKNAHFSLKSLYRNGRYQEYQQKASSNQEKNTKIVVT